MSIEKGTYDNELAMNINLSDLSKLMTEQGAADWRVLKLAPNDNSKNQIYITQHLPDVSFFPMSELIASETYSNKKKLDKHAVKFHAELKFRWIGPNGKTYSAPNAKIIYYPQYPEVRLSGFLKGSNVKLSQWMNVNKKGRDEGRWIVLGFTKNKEIIAYFATSNSVLANELSSKVASVADEKLFELAIDGSLIKEDHRASLLAKLKGIHKLGWMTGRRLDKDLNTLPYKAPNGGGYTLEALLGVAPNGYAEPDYLGWEVKQFGVKDFHAKGVGPTTLFTPEPNGGMYVKEGFIQFITKYGYPDKSGIPDRMNFGGKHVVGSLCKATNLTMRLRGFDHENQRMSDAKGAVELVDDNNKVAASWSFSKIMDHWKNKHSKTVYVPCKKRIVSGTVEYCYGDKVELGEGTNFDKFLSAMNMGAVYFDPGMKLESISSSKPVAKRRSQFRIAHKDIKDLYLNFGIYELLG